MAILCFDSIGNQVTRLYQWDVNQKLIFSGIPTSPLPEFQFANRNRKTSISVTPVVSESNLIVDLPNDILEEAEPIFAYVYMTRPSGAGRTIGSIFIPVVPRIKPCDNEDNDISKQE